MQAHITLVTNELIGRGKEKEGRKGGSGEGWREGEKGNGEGKLGKRDREYGFQQSSQFRSRLLFRVNVLVFILPALLRRPFEHSFLHSQLRTFIFSQFSILHGWQEKRKGEGTTTAACNPPPPPPGRGIKTLPCLKVKRSLRGGSSKGPGQPPKRETPTCFSIPETHSETFLMFWAGEGFESSEIAILLRIPLVLCCCSYAAALLVLQLLLLLLLLSPLDSDCSGPARNDPKKIRACQDAFDHDKEQKHTSLGCCLQWMFFLSLQCSVQFAGELHGVGAGKCYLSKKVVRYKKKKSFRKENF